MPVGGSALVISPLAGVAALLPGLPGEHAAVIGINSEASADAFKTLRRFIAVCPQSHTGWGAGFDHGHGMCSVLVVMCWVKGVFGVSHGSADH